MSHHSTKRRPASPHGPSPSVPLTSPRSSIDELLRPWLHFDGNERRSPWARGLEIHWDGPKGLQLAPAVTGGGQIKLLTSASKRNVLYCQAPKTGSSAWLLALHVANRNMLSVRQDRACHAGTTSLRERLLHKQRIDRQTVLETDPHCIGRAAKLTRADVNRLMDDNATVRIMMVRDPYARLLSAFLDKVPPSAHHLRRVPTMQPTPANFVHFVESYLLPHRPPADWHFALQSDHCGLRAGGDYDYYLKLEEMHLWYEPFVRAMGLEDAVSSGWNVTTPYWNGTASVPCFYTTPGRTCEEMLRPNGGVRSDERSDTRSDEQWRQRQPPNVTAGRASHSRGTADLLTTYYSNRTLVERITAYVMPDLMRFGYRPWVLGRPDRYLYGTHPS